MDWQRQELEDTRDVLQSQQKAQEALTEAQIDANRIADAQRLLDDRRLDWEKEAEQQRHAREMLSTCDARQRTR